MLPSNATSHSVKLSQVAQHIVEHAPSLATEIILEGSVARGFADRFSDIELQFLSEDVPPLADIALWMQSVGFHGELLVRRDNANSILVNQRYDDIRIELFWTSFEYEAQQLDGIMAQLGSDAFINEVYKWSDAILLRAGPNSRNWQAMFKTYPDAVRDQYILPILEAWRIELEDPIDTLGRWKDAYRGAWFYLLKTHWMDVLPLLRILFAYNRVWEPVAKWWHTVDPKLVEKPENFVLRINDVLSNPDPVARIDQLSQLQIETLQVIASDYDVQDILDRLQAIRAYGLATK